MRQLFSFLFTTIFLFLILNQTTAQGTRAREEANIDQVYSEFELSGEGIIMVIIDRGIDYYHTDFIDENGKTRILYIYDMINQQGANDEDNPYGIGTIFDEAEINASLETDGTPLSQDRYGHGTAISGIAGGNGTGSENGEFHGVAYNARYIIIKAVQDYFPPFNGQEGQDGFYDPTYIPIALDFAADKLGGYAMPSVTLLNMGSIGGPTDGTSTIARAIDNYVDQGYPFVCGVGDDGGNYNHASTTIPEGESIDLTIEKNVDGNLRLDLWYDEADRFEVSITRPDNSTEGPFPSPATANDKDDRFLTGLSYYHRGANLDFYGATSDRRELMIDITGATGEYTITLKATSIGGSGSFHATLNPSTFGNNNMFTSYEVWGYSINDFASATKAIVPTDYIVDNSWTDMDGVERSMTGQGVQGGIWVGSSIGPTQDGRIGVDFAACGEVLYGAYSPNTYYSSFNWLFVQGGDYNYGIQNAVSAAAPLSMGVIALMLEFRSQLTPAEIKTTLQVSAVKDSYTDTIANRVYGHGKLDAYMAVKNIEAAGILNKQTNEDVFMVYPNPVNQTLYLKTKNTCHDCNKLVISNIAGQKVKEFELNRLTSMPIDVSGLPDGLYLVSLHSNSGCYTQRFVKY